MWDADEQVFKLRDQVLELEVADMYFITRLSPRGPVPILTGSRPSGKKMEQVMARVCRGAQLGSRSGKVDIHTIPDLALRVVLHTITQAAGSQAPHEATKAQILLASECMTSLLFDWATTVMINMKRQLTKCKQDKLK